MNFTGILMVLVTHLFLSFIHLYEFLIVELNKLNKIKQQILTRNVKIKIGV